ncbi:SANT/Myb_domain [Hexamita inflata]|uniref:SANT/Myb domain n=1 Tax=Hexamita inflata TaxID=28002 RepID=A0AA86UYE5_9EUKA|nr:SANT/Myb domain [Hexamita inflata]
MSIFNQQLIQIHLLQQIERTRDQIKNQIHINNKSKTNKKRQFWTKQQDEELIQQINQIGIMNYKQISVQNKTSSQVYFRLRYLKGVYLQNKDKFDEELKMFLQNK